MEINKPIANKISHNYNHSMEFSETTFADSLRKLRSWKDVSQAQLGKALNVTDTTISAWENSKLNRVPNKTIIDNLVDYFAVELEQTGINLYEDAGYYVSQIPQSNIKSIDERLSSLEKKIDLLVKAYAEDQDVQT
jgi:transcriptional regulator with XRE-family HTH domain